MHEQRMTTRMINYWQSLRKEEDVPPFTRFNAGTIQDIWPNCAVLHVQPKADHSSSSYRYEHCGDEIAKAVGRNLSGEHLSLHMKHFPGIKIVRRIDEITAQHAPEPIQDEGQFVNSQSKVVKYRACLLPFTEATSQRTSHVVVAVSWRAF